MTNEEFVTTVEVAGEEYELIKKGAPQADQIRHILKWMSTYLSGIIAEFTNEKGELEFDNIFILFGKVSDVVSTQALLELFSLVVGCSPEVTQEHFDIAILIDAVDVVWNNHPSFARVIKRFFSTD